MSSNNKNIVEFPKNKIIREVPPNIEALQQAKEKGLQKFADSVVDDLVGQIMDNLDNYGIETDSKDFIKDFSLTVDSLRSSVYRTFELKHTLQEFVDKNVKIVNMSTGEVIKDIEGTELDIEFNPDFDFEVDEKD